MSDFEFAGKNPFTDSPKNNTPLGTKTIDFSNEFKDISVLEDFGRESLGIFDINNVDFGRESLLFQNNDPGRESLGIINLNNLDIGRESLGISNINTYDFLLSNANLPPIVELKEINDVSNAKSPLLDTSNKNGACVLSSDGLPEVLISKDDNSNSVTSILNTAFVRQPLSVSSSISSLWPSFNSASLGSTLPSRISTSSNSYLDMLNDAFEDTSQFMERLLKIKTSVSSAYSPLYKKIELNNAHRRIHSLPSTLSMKSKDFEAEEELNCSLKKPEEKLHTTVDLEDECGDDGFNDSVFIEGKHIASRLADGSILEADENDMLDSTQEPEDFANISVNDEPVKADTETVFKVVDKMFLPSDKSNNASGDSNNLNIPEKCNNSNCSNNISYKSNHSSSKSKEAIEIISTLSEILSNDAPTEKQKTEGQNLLSSLADILLSSTSTKSPSHIMEDSGHSSIESEPAMTSEACYEVLDLRKKSCSQTNISQPEEVCVPLDLSLKSKSGSEKSFVSPKILPPKYSKNPHKSLMNPQINLSLASNCSVSSNDSKNSNDSSSKFKPKKPAAKVAPVKRGPMKAVLPVDNMARRNSINSKITPKRSETKSSNSKLKKTSTPINETNLKPMAQSTPDNLKAVCPPSPVARPNLAHDASSKGLKQKLNYSGSNLSANKSLDNKNKAGSFIRRGSSAELKRPQSTQNSGKTLVRSRSLGEKFGISSAAGSSIKQTSQRNSLSHSKTERSSVLKENRSKPMVRSSIGKKIGKENHH